MGGGEVTAQELAVLDYRVAGDVEVANSAIGAEDQPGQGVENVGDVVAGPHG